MAIARPTPAQKLRGAATRTRLLMTAPRPRASTRRSPCARHARCGSTGPARSRTRWRRPSSPSRRRPCRRRRAARPADRRNRRSRARLRRAVPWTRARRSPCPPPPPRSARQALAGPPARWRRHRTRTRPRARRRGPRVRARSRAFARRNPRPLSPSPACPGEACRRDPLRSRTRRAALREAEGRRRDRRAPCARPPSGPPSPPPSGHRPELPKSPRETPHRFFDARRRRDRRRRLEAGVDAAVLAAVVVPRPVALPLDAVYERLVGRENAVGEEVARAFPAVRVPRHGAPGGARELAVTGEEVLVDRARQPLVAVLAHAVADRAELLLVLRARHRERGVDLGVLVAGRDEHPVDADLVGEEAHHLEHVVDVRLLECGRVRRHAEAGFAGLADRRDRDLPEARVVADVVVDLLHAVEVDDESETRVRLEPVEHVGEAKRVRTKLDVPLHLEKAADNVLDALEDERLAAADGDDRSRALDRRLEAFLDGQPGLVRLVLANLSAADAGDVAAESRLQHDHERVAVVLLLRGDVAPDLDGAAKRKLHAPPFRVSASAVARAKAGSTGPDSYPSLSRAFSEEKYIGMRASLTSCAFAKPAFAAATATGYGTRSLGRGAPARSAMTEKSSSRERFTPPRR